MQVILREDISNLGKSGELVSVKPGYGRNFLIPQGLAVLATERNVKLMEHHKRTIAQRNAKLLKDAQSVSDKLAGITLKLRAKRRCRQAVRHRLDPRHRGRGQESRRQPGSQEDPPRRAHQDRR